MGNGWVRAYDVLEIAGSSSASDIFAHIYMQLANVLQVTC